MKILGYSLILIALLAWLYFRRQKMGAGSGQQRQSSQRSHKKSEIWEQDMPLQQAHDLLGLTQPCSIDMVIDAHRKLMQKLHPDKGGTVALAQQINQAKHVLLKHYEDT